MLDVDIIEINDEQAYNAKLLASSLSTPQTRKRGMIEMLGISCAISYLNARKFRIDTRRSVYKIPLLFEEFKLCDIYYGNWRIDVITLYKEKTVKIPKIHVDMDIMPHFYFIVQIGSKIKEAKMIGFIDSKNIPSCSHDSKFYYPTLDMIFDIRKFATLTKHSTTTKTLLGKHVDCMGLFLKFIDNDLSSVYKRQLIQHLMNCDSCRARFIDAVEFEKLANNIKFYPNLLRKNESKIPAMAVSTAFDRQNNFTTFEEGLNNVIIEEQSPDNVSESFIDIQPNYETNGIKNNIPKTVQMFDLLDKNDKKQASKKVIDAIFDEIPKVELPPIKTIINAKNKRMLMIFVVIFFILGSFALISMKGTSEILEENKEIASFEEPFEDLNEEYSENYNYSTGKAKLIPKEENIEDFSIKQPAPSQPAYAPTITRIAWEAPESITKKDSYKKYLQLTGKNIKLNLQNELLLVNDIPVNKVVKADIRIASNGDIDSIKITTSSGSELIDASVKKVITDTLTYMKPPSHGIISRPVDITLTAEMN